MGYEFLSDKVELRFGVCNFCLGFILLQWVIKVQNFNELVIILFLFLSKNCFEDLNEPAEDYGWSIDSLRCDAKARTIDFISCSFCSVRREANSVAHFLVKFTCLKILTLFGCNKINLTPSVLEVWLRDMFPLVP